MIDLNPNVPPPTPPTTSRAPLVGVIVLICLAAFVGGVFVTNLWEEATEGRDEAEESAEIVEEQEADDETEDGTDDEEVALVSTDEVLQIDWIDPSSQPTYPDDTNFTTAVCYSQDSETGENWNECEEDPNDMTRWSYKLGTVQGGAYDGRDLVMTTVPFAGMGTNYTSFYFLKDSVSSEEPVLLDYVRDVFFAGSTTSTLSERDWLLIKLEGFTVDASATIPEFEFEQIYHDTEGNEYFFTGYWHRLYSEQGTALTGSTKSVARTDGGSLRLYEPKRDVNGGLLEGQTSAGENQFFDVDEDGRVLFYDLRPPFFDYQVDDVGNIITYAMGRPLVSWDDGTVSNEDIYFKGQVGGCGFTNVTRVISQSTIDSLGLVQAGEGFTEDERYPVYEPASYDLEYYDEAFTIVTWEQEGQEVKTYDDFDHPFFYYQDGQGRWVEFMSNEIVPPVECGKPVIYLYPESTTDMSVWVKPRGGFSYTEPEYGDGWDVTAYPDGRIVNREDGLEYPYLFWEGRGGLYTPVETYWVVERTGVESFLRETLVKMNFNQNEIADFVEFWLPRMQEAAYYKIGFHGTNVMNELAPLSLSVKPDHIFRILMDYEGLDVWQSSKPPTRLPRANRDGFEVMEWGGVLR